MSVLISIYLIIGITIYVIFKLNKVRMEGSFIQILLFMVLAWPLIVYMIYRIWREQ